MLWDLFANLETQERMRTLGNILSKTAFVTVFVVVIMILREVGMDITPLTSGAGIIGLAIGFDT